MKNSFEKIKNCSSLFTRSPKETSSGLSTKREKGNNGKSSSRSTQGKKKMKSKSPLGGKSLKKTQKAPTERTEFDTNHEEKEKAKFQNARLKDLCAEDKGKIGDLIKRLAEEKKTKEQIIQEYEQDKKKLTQSISQLKLNANVKHI